jgi:hypothetical protein
MKWSTHSRRIDPISRSAKPFCQGEAGAVGLKSALRLEWCGQDGHYETQQRDHDALRLGDSFG